MKPKILAVMGGGTMIFLSSFALQNNNWIAPATAASKQNPIASNEKSIKLGKKIYSKMCWTCHGSIGEGDGPASNALTPKPAVLTNAIVQEQTDGALFWKITTGKGTMVSYKTSLSDDQRWSLVNYIRTLKK